MFVLLPHSPREMRRPHASEMLPLTVAFQGHLARETGHISNLRYSQFTGGLTDSGASSSSGTTGTRDDGS